MNLLDSFMPVSASTLWYGKAKEQGKRNNLEYRLMYGIVKPFEDRGDNVRLSDWHVAGVFLAAPSGKVLGGLTFPPGGDTAAQMRRALAAYKALPREERLLPKPPNPATDRISFREYVPGGPTELHPPSGGLTLRVVQRIRRADTRRINPQIDREDSRLDDGFQLDRLWVLREEVPGLVPSPLQPGVKQAVKGAAFDRMLRTGLGVHILIGNVWEPKHVREARLTAEVKAVEGTKAHLLYEGRVRLRDPEYLDYGVREYDGDLLGKATYDLEKRQFTAFELLAVGTHVAGKYGAARYGTVFTLAPGSPGDEVAPQSLERYEWACSPDAGIGVHRGKYVPPAAGK
jgi:hypothetical protein